MSIYYAERSFNEFLFRRNQLIVWGSICGVILLAVVIFLYVKMDSYICKGPILFNYSVCGFVNNTHHSL